MEKKKLVILLSVAFLSLISVIAAIYTGSDSYARLKSQKNMPEKSLSEKNVSEKTGIGETTRMEKTVDIPRSEEVKSEITVSPRTAGEQKEKKSSFKDIKVKALYLTGPSAGNKSLISHIIDLAATTELNAVVIDVKEGGIVNYASEVPAVKDNKLYTRYFDPEEVVGRLHDNGVYVIGRIVCFRDNGLATKRADLAIKRPDGTLWREGGMGAWTNPYNEEVWNYNIDIAREAVDKGFDEIQFDYVRFPTARNKDVNYGANVPSKSSAICNFLKTAAKALGEEKGAKVSADIFGIVCESPSDGEAIGQELEKVGADIDYISPMVYPSHYANASKGVMGNGSGQSINGVNFTAPDLKPYEVVYNTLLRAKDRLSKVEGYKAKIRPYLQDFTATYIKDKNYYQTYGPEQVRQQIKAVYDAGYEEWILWSGINKYSETAFLKK